MAKNIDFIPKVGPIENIEEHLDKEWWKYIFNNEMFDQTNGFTCTTEITEREIGTVRRALPFRRQERILDLACGNGRHALALATQGFEHVHGIDLSDRLLEKGSQEQRRLNLAVSFRKGDIRQTGYEDAYFDKIIMMGNSFGYFYEDEENIQVVEEVIRILKPGGYFLLDNGNGAYIRQHYVPHLWRWLPTGHLACYSRDIKDKRMITREIVVSLNSGLLADNIYCVRLFDREEIKKIFQQVGFIDVAFHGDIDINLKNPAEGIGMASRIMVSGRKPIMMV